MKTDTMARRRQTFVALVLAAVAVAGLASLTASAAGAAGKSESVITVGTTTDEFPPVLNMITPEGNGQWTGMIVGPALARGYKLLPDFSYQPWIFDKDCTVPSISPFTVDCTIRPDAKWSDGVPITADDFKFTYETIMDKKNNVVTRNGYDKIREFNVISPTEFQMVFEEIFAPYRDLWASTSTVVLPKHILEGTDFNKVWNNCICDPKTKKPIASGPMMVQSFSPGHQVTLVPNKNYWGKKATVSKVVFVPTGDSEVNAFRAGEVDMIYPQNQIGLRKRIESADGAKYASSLGPQWEHFDMLTTVPGLDDLAVRKAIATAMPRQQIVDRVVKDANANASVLDNTMWMTNQAAYQPNWNIYPASGDVNAANQMLDAAGWTRGPDGVRQKNGVKLAFTVGTTTGNQARELSEQIMQAQFKKIGVKLTIKNAPDMLDTKIVGFDYQTILFAWVGSPDPYSNNVIWLSGAIPQKCSPRLARAQECDYSGLNYTKLRDPALDEILNATDREPDAAKRAALYNQADVQLAQNDVTTIPLFQKPTQLGYRNTITGVRDNPTVDGFTWNIEDWAVRS
ncbi:MAG TPA: peptide ABC transporter substrate-binding protein [Acidimicrobiia bacterium]|nr:peptide ABC transporter substrate-binding protein [Acidimicrobiia bacterium]